MKFLLMMCSVLAVVPLCGENLLTDGSFEETVPPKKKRWQVELLKEWQCNLNSGADKCDIRLSAPGFSGKQAVRLRTLGKEGFASVIHRKTFPVSQGDLVTASVMMKGKGIGYCRIYFHDDAGNRLKAYRMLGKSVTSEFTPLVLKFTVPAGVAGVRFALETLRNDADVIFDDAKLTVSAGEVLENAAVRLTFDPRLGGGISSFFWKEKNFDFTTARTLTKGGNMVNCVIPDSRIPGVFYNLPFVRTSRTKETVTYTAKVTSGPLADLTMTKSYTLLPEGVKLDITLANTGKQEREISWRIQNFISSAPGVWSWPTPDWITVFRQTGKPLNGLNAVVQDLFRAGWEAKFYEELQASLLFEFDVRTVRRLYCYFSMAPRFSTAEWYFREFKLAPGAEKKISATIRIVKDQHGRYTDACGARQKSEEIKPITMPEPPPKATLPPRQFRNYFPYVGGGGNLNQPEMAGSVRRMTYPRSYAVIVQRLFRIQTDAYINSFAPGRLIYGSMHKHLWTEDGKHLLGEMCRRLGLKYYLSTLFLHREDLDVAKYMKEKWPKLRKTMTDPDLQRFIRMYQEQIPVIYTADELLPQNVDVMLKAHEELKKLLPEHIVPFPYLNSSAVDILPYVPVFVGDWYPVKRPHASGRNPWSVYPEFSALVKRAGETPVWFMPQGFAGSGATNRLTVYALPTAGETRLMLHLAAAAGVKGIAWHGFPSGTWPWMMNYSMYRYSFLGGGGQRSPSWPGVKSAGRAFASAGPLLSAASPVPLPGSVKVGCRDFTSYNHFYSGKAVKAYALKTPKGMVLIFVNQNPEANEKCTVSLPGGNAFDLIGLKELGSTAAFDLEPGDAAYVYCGDDAGEPEAAFTSRFRAERARYLLRADCAAGFGIRTVDPDTFGQMPILKGLRALLAEQQELEKRIAAHKGGKVLADLEATRQLLDKIDFRLCCALDIVVTPEMRKATGRYARWTAHPDRGFEKLRMDLARCFADFYRISDAVETGGGFKAATGLSELRRNAEKTAQAINAWLDEPSRKDLIDDPYAK